MRVRLLGGAGAEFPDFRPPAFLIDDRPLLDADTIGAVVREEEPWQLRDSLISHTHLDHSRCIPALADTLIIRKSKQLVAMYIIGPVVILMASFFSVV